MVKAMEQALGVVTLACRNMGISRFCHYNWYKLDEEYRMAIDELPNVTLDFCESKLYELIKEGNVTAIIFYLKTKGKNRGYIEKYDNSILNDERFNSVKIQIIDKIDE